MDLNNPLWIVTTLFTAVVAALGSYFGAYVKPKAELRAAREDLKHLIENQIALTRAVEGEKLSVSEKRRCVAALVGAIQALLHSMCWLSWDSFKRSEVRLTLVEQYNSEAHKLLPEIAAQMSILGSLDTDLFARLRPVVEALDVIDGRFGLAILRSEQNLADATGQFKSLHKDTLLLKQTVNQIFVKSEEPRGYDEDVRDWLQCAP